MIPVRVSIETDTWHYAREDDHETLCGREPKNLPALMPIGVGDMERLTPCGSCAKAFTDAEESWDSLGEPVEHVEQPENLTLHWVPIEQLVPNERNPNVMDDREFNALVEAIEEEGFIEPLQVVQLADEEYEIVGGHHRWEAAKYLRFAKLPCVLLDADKFDADRRNWNLVKLNIVRGKLNPDRFTSLYNDMAERYGNEVLQSLMGFTTEDAFQKLYKDLRKSLSPDMRKALDDTQDEIKTIDDLSIVLNGLFAEFGETLPSNMMVFSWGGKDVLWVRTNAELWKLVKKLSNDTAKEHGDFAEALLERLTATDS